MPWTRVDNAYAPNGGESGWKSLSQKDVKSKDIAENKKIDYSVYDFSHDNVEVMPWTRVEEAYAPNGVESGWKSLA
jgi:hypothetical protein